MLMQAKWIHFPLTRVFGDTRLEKAKGTRQDNPFCFLRKALPPLSLYAQNRGAVRHKEVVSGRLFRE